MASAPDPGAEPAPGSELLRFAAVGSVDDGKSTLIGRLLHDTKQLFEDQIEAISTASRRRGVEGVDLSFVTDGLRAEREQGITIDVAYRYAATPNRKFIIADCPGHVQYTRNMATGASTADLVVVVVDATTGLREQTRRHCCIAALLGVRHMVVAANKMDLVDWSPDAYHAIAAEADRLAARFGMQCLVVPVSALHGDNVADRSSRSPWYAGPTVLQALEDAPAGAWAHEGGGGARLPVQWVIRHPNAGRSYAGMVSGGTLFVGEEVVVLPSGAKSTVTAISTFDGPLAAAPPSMSVTVALDDDLDVSRGDVIAPAADAPEATGQFTATVCWFAERPIEAGQRFTVKHTTRTTAARVLSVDARLDVGTLTLADADALADNEIGVVQLATATPLALDPYHRNRVTGSFVVVDPTTNATLAAGMVGPPVLAASPAPA